MKDIITAMRVRAIETNKYSVVLTHGNGDKTGYLVSKARVFEMIDELKIR